MHAGTLEITKVSDVVESYATVELDDQIRPDLHVRSMESSEGIVSGKVILEQTFGTDYAMPNTLNRHLDADKPILPRARVRIKVGKTVMFLGSIVRRLDKGKTDLVSWIAEDDSSLLKEIPIRGALVRDLSGTDPAAQFKFISRFVPRTNPTGLWNCVGAKFTMLPGSADDMIVPVFASIADLGKTYEKPDEGFDGPLRDGVLAPWTPRRWLYYLWVLANINWTLPIPGMMANSWRSIYDSERLSWDIDSITGMTGYDPASRKDDDTKPKSDPLDRKMPDMTFRGKKMLQAIEDALKMAGTHGQKLSFGPEEVHPQLGAERMDVRRSLIDFYPKGFSSITGPTNKAIPILRGGNADDINTAHDFTLDEDWSMVAESCLAEGAPVMLEASLNYLDDPDNDTLKPAWEPEERIAFMYAIRGFLEGGDSTLAEFAMIPDVQGSITDFDKWKPANGEEGRPEIYPNSMEAVQIARAMFPTVFRAFKIDTDNLSELAGVDDVFANQNNYPRLSTNRSVLANQMQYLLRDLSGTDSSVNWLRTQYPIRIRVADSVDKFFDAPLGTGVRVTGDGLIWLDGIGESVDRPAGQSPLPWCLYAGSLYDYKTNDGYAPTLKKIKINAAMPMDHRVSGYREIEMGGGKSIFSPSYKKAVGGSSLLYIDSPDAYHEVHQVDSQPSPDISYHEWKYGAEEEERTGATLNRLLPPGSESFSAADAAERKLASSKHSRRRTSWILAGVRPEFAFSAGDWIQSVHVVGGSAGDVDYIIDAPAGTITFDFVKQETIIGGLISEITPPE